MSTPKSDTNLDAATQQFKDLNERLIDTGRKVGNLYLDNYEKTVQGVTAFQKKIAEQTPIEGVQTLVDAQVDLTRELAKSQTALAREILA